MGGELAAVAAYNDWVPAFEALLAESGGDLPVFYARVRELGSLDKTERALAMRRLSPRIAQAQQPR